MRMWRWLPVCCALAGLLGCTRMVSGAAELPPTEAAGPMPPAGVDVEQIMLDVERMRAITGAGPDLTIIPTMDTRAPVDIDPLADTVPAPCRFVYAETATFGTQTTQFHKTTFQYPPRSALISEAAAAYRDADAARGVFDRLVADVTACSAGSAGVGYVGEFAAEDESLRTGTGRCGSHYRIKSAVLLEVTFCGFRRSVAELVITNLAAGVPD